MEGDRKIVLIQPGQDTVDPVTKQHSTGSPIRHTAYATRMDRFGGGAASGKVEIEDDQYVGQWNARYQIRMSPVWDDIALNWKAWRVVDEYGREGSIEKIEEAAVPGKPYRRYWDLYIATSR